MLIKLLSENHLLLLFVVIALGYVVGRINFWGVRFGLAAVLFAGLGIGAFSPDLRLPELVYRLGLVIFVYALGINSGGTVLPSLRGRGLIINAVVAGILVIAALGTATLKSLFDLSPARSAGMFTGSLTNTPALAGLIDYIKTHTPGSAPAELLAEPVVGYSIAYLIGVLGMIAAIIITQRILRVDFEAEAEQYGQGMAAHAKLQGATVLVTNPEATAISVDQIIDRHHSKVMIGRYKRGGKYGLAIGSVKLCLGDVVSVVGTEDKLAPLVKFLGEESHESIDLDRSEMDYRRIFVSNPNIAGMRLKDLNLPQQFGAVVTRVRRGDVEFVPRGSTILQSGDRVRVVTRRDNMDTLSQFFGDSYRAVSELDFVTLGIGITLGLLLGIVPIPLPGGMSVELGMAGGPLVIGLILGALRRTGPITWTVPYSANLMLSQIGLGLFFAGVGTRAGYSFVSALKDSSGWVYLGCGAAITILVAVLTIIVCYRLLKLPLAKAFGIMAGLQTQPSVLEFACEHTKNDLPKIGFSMVYPVATLVKILAAQLLFVFLT